MPKKKVLHIAKSGKMTIRSKRKKSGLTKPQKKETKAIVKSAIKKEHTLKYFDVDSTFTAAAPAVSQQANALKQISVLGYSSTTNENNAGVTQNYGSQAFIPLYLARPFKENNPTSELATNALNGQYILPKKALSRFSMERVAYVVGTANSPQYADDDMAETLPVHYRIIKVEIKAQQGTMEVVDPNNDLFLDQHGQPTGIDQPNFDRLVIKFAPVNSKKYKKISDIQGTLNQNNVITPTLVGNAGTANAYTDTITQKNGSSEKYFTVPFQLSARKGGKLFYQDPQQSSAVQTFTSGGKRQLLLIHTWFGCGHNLLGAANQPNAPTGTTIQIKHKAEAAFVDAQ